MGGRGTITRRASQRAGLVGVGLVLTACGGIDDRNPSLLPPLGFPEGSTPSGGESQNDGSGSTDGLEASEGQEQPPANARRTDGMPAQASPPIDESRGEPASEGPGSAPMGPAAAALLVASAASHAFGSVEVNAGQSSFTWVVTNAGDAATAPLGLGRVGHADFAGDGGCSAPLEPGDSCSVSIGFVPVVDGERSATLSLQDGRGASTSLAVNGRGAFRLTVDVAGGGEVSASRAGLECTSTECTGLFDRGAIALDARVDNGSERFFSGWSVRACRASQSCTLSLSESTRVRAAFSAMQNNLVFATSSTYPGNLGGLAAYDAACNRHASEAGINDAQGRAFVAAMSDSRTTLRSRLGAARGWVRMDGLTFGDTVDDIVGGLGVRYSIDYTERGELVHGPLGGATPLGFAMTGTTHDLTGPAAPFATCNDWTSVAEGSLVVTGQVVAGVDAWLSSRRISCSFDKPVICMDITRSRPAPISVVAGKQMWTTTPYRTGTQTPDQKCQSERPAGVASAAAFVAYSNQPAAAVLDLDATYVRPDGALIGSGRDVADLDLPGAGPWILADGSAVPYQFGLVWTGGSTPQLPAASDSNCSDWRSTSPDAYGFTGDYGVSEARFFNTGAVEFCDQAVPIYCVER